MDQSVDEILDHCKHKTLVTVQVPDRGRGWSGLSRRGHLHRMRWFGRCGFSVPPVIDVTGGLGGRRAGPGRGEREAAGGERAAARGHRPTGRRARHGKRSDGWVGGAAGGSHGAGRRVDSPGRRTQRPGWARTRRTLRFRRRPRGYARSLPSRGSGAPASRASSPAPKAGIWLRGPPRTRSSPTPPRCATAAGPGWPTHRS